ncbi:MAG TPA: c-type cytochrome [Candidatus Polarisedimenticolia bacterium]|nr:c-type cytochrome [Candidatus Polarisedimenticolia bacterium]
MMTARFTAVAALLLLAACDSAPGRPARGSEAPDPREVADFRVLYAANCAGCHGAQGRGGAAIGLADAVYLAIADDASIRKVVAEGVRGTAMPAFAQSAGGMLTEAQIDALTSGIRSWARPIEPGVAILPAHAATSAGDPRRGLEAYGTYCSSCHGARGEGGAGGSAIVNDSFLALVSDQGLRTTIIAGRADLGAPDWRGNRPGRPMSEQEITDVVAWLASQRVPSPGRPYGAPADDEARSASNESIRSAPDHTQR